MLATTSASACVVSIGEKSLSVLPSHIAALDISQTKNPINHWLDILAMWNHHILVGASGWIIDRRVVSIILTATARPQRDMLNTIADNASSKDGEAKHLLFAQISIDTAGHIRKKLLQVI